MKLFIALFSGILFGIGLIISQMVNPNKIFNFLDITGDWDPSLALVMGSALLLFIPVYRILKKKLKQPLFANEFSLPVKTLIDRPLIIGAGLFGIGWGISGICPGPAIVNVSAGDPKIMVFIFAMMLGMYISNYVNITLSKPKD
ncbi:YeeE/YedE family protein [Moritella sp. Urea-trap-13]|uniref:YeeE/YedE family protein n=1 Tax=Moritella sp. Urea-trap-13 TaxID=2058327 RepID=UPI000C33C38D|nr:YeeE/YedE family protein [Moritella sp. Urea-trap-13]PKH06787.1 YeeE/YedE family protein [Moritella sp. Urea-trap-13]